MNGKLTLSFTVATFIGVLAAMYFLSEVRVRLQRLERRAETADAAPAPDTGDERVVLAPEGPDAGPDGAEEPPVAPLDTKDPLVKLDWLIHKLDEVDTRVYEGVVDLESEIYQLKRQVNKVQIMTRRMLDGLRSSGQYEGLLSTLPEPKQPLSPDQIKSYTAEAKKFAIEIAPGRVVARGLLNGAQDKAYPIEYFMTRFPDAGHETLVHLMGHADLEDFREPPYPSLEGLPTALYKALLIAGFEQGKGTHPEGEPKPGEPINWILATGDTVYMYVRWKQDGETKYARATDWIIDPSTKSVLPEDCFRFTGSMRVENNNTGDEMLLAEARGFLVSVYPDRAAMVEVALASASQNNYQYNWSRLPKHEEGKPFYMDVIFSKTPLDKAAIEESGGSGDEPDAAQDEEKK